MFGLLVHAETAFVPLLRLGGVILRELALDGDMRELAILQVGRLTARLYSCSPGPIGGRSTCRPGATTARRTAALEQRRQRWAGGVMGLGMCP